MEKNQIKSVMIALPIMLAVAAGVYFLCNHFQLPIGLAGALLLFVSVSVCTITEYHKLKKPHKVGFIGLMFGTGVLSVLFAYDHFVRDIRITAIHIGMAVLPPVLIGNWLLKKEEKKP